jgi:hypothetical protein
MPTTTPGLTTHDLGNNESRATGMTLTNAGWMCLTGTQSKILRTEIGAMRWLAKRGLGANGARLSPLEALTILGGKLITAGKRKGR